MPHQAVQQRVKPFSLAGSSALKQTHWDMCEFVKENIKYIYIYRNFLTSSLTSNSVVLTSSATRLPPLCTVFLHFSFRNHLHRHCYHRHHRHHRQSKFIECGQTAYHVRLRRRTSQVFCVVLAPCASCTRSTRSQVPFPANFSVSGFRISIFFVNFSTEAQTGRYLCNREQSSWLCVLGRRWQ
jgi:hypothetical protein